ncbi:hypothetical protein AB4305_27395 [Nocardia sp. 2YAB30]|uniref:hypothetical protein n=1 Tax=Nocardia sp. 2YAB30 TaxID=3233022 RepID=UPI003F96B782
MAGPVGVLHDQVLLHTNQLTAQQIIPLPSSIAGLVLSGKKAAAGIKKIRQSDSDLLLLRDPEGYRRALARRRAAAGLVRRIVVAVPC